MADKVILFFINGLRVLRESAAGRYEQESDEVKAIRAEVMSPASDAESLREDFRNVARDFRVSFDKITLQ